MARPAELGEPDRRAVTERFLQGPDRGDMRHRPDVRPVRVRGVGRQIRR